MVCNLYLLFSTPTLLLSINGAVTARIPASAHGIRSPTVKEACRSRHLLVKCWLNGRSRTRRFKSFVQNFRKKFSSHVRQPQRSDSSSNTLGGRISHNPLSPNSGWHIIIPSSPTVACVTYRYRGVVTLFLAVFWPCRSTCKSGLLLTDWAMTHSLYWMLFWNPFSGFWSLLRVWTE